ncbi:protein of unknown function [Candidatus Nitrosacidococcus tergens]|uniref:Uncharacterized protein n=1 Tax=Candidatus Nitrosacidococcus tergens TaxID=553981 RepID=A0A7G1QB24_9GAMM|nr:protein of unknown function [Candidatus Nitrosacidococcus tergens]
MIHKNSIYLYYFRLMFINNTGLRCLNTIKVTKNSSPRSYYYSILSTLFEIIIKKKQKSGD